jgi:hypothetical protein
MEPARHETSREILDRELVEILQELRVALAGVQILFAFLLTLPFSTGFHRIGYTGRWVRDLLQHRPQQRRAPRIPGRQPHLLDDIDLQTRSCAPRQPRSTRSSSVSP